MYFCPLAVKLPGHGQILHYRDNIIISTVERINLVKMMTNSGAAIGSFVTNVLIGSALALGQCSRVYCLALSGY